LLMLLAALLLGSCQTVALEPTDVPQQKVSTASVPNCGPKDLMTGLLGKTFAEQPLLHGVAADGSVFTIHAGPNGSWTLTRIVNDIMCIMVVGTELKIMELVPGATI